MCKINPCKDDVLDEESCQPEDWHAGPIPEPQEPTDGQAKVEARPGPEPVQRDVEPSRESIVRDPETGKPRTYYRGEPGSPTSNSAATVIGPYPEFDGPADDQDWDFE